MNPALPPFSKPMRILVILFFSVWFFGQVLLEKLLGISLTPFLALTPSDIIFDGFLWQFLTYMFFHSLDVTHILFNLLMLWFLGADLEKTWGSRYFIYYFFLSGIGASILYTLSVTLWFRLTGDAEPLGIPVVGASGGVFGLLVAYGILYSERVIHFMMIFPMKAKYFVLILAGVELLTMLTHGINGGGVANLAHLGGALSGFLILLITTYLKKKKPNGSIKKPASSKLKIVVNNEKPNHLPKYWN